ncbi:hypothetical protein AMTRI_Chr08g163760 [Amborella trichopoda]|uniref:Dirigent protein n=1 Tax=Amborella trichopoda TaxID=13333 RepID=W1PQH3_AMBTC|nr:dirigent protein 9 [Amborella trichopoda]ERN12277.1 hypothetical protein AMTR_s00034p00240460 [Amborella trichopoda]|eukprot:XP_006850696.1 dirigent protein 9 [Amborella trichopoda]
MTNPKCSPFLKIAFLLMVAIVLDRAISARILDEGTPAAAAIAPGALAPALTLPATTTPAVLATVSTPSTVTPAVPATLSTPSPVPQLIPTGAAPEAQPVPTDTPPVTQPIPTDTTLAKPIPMITAPVAQPVPTGAASAAQPISVDAEHPITFFMHDIVGGTHPSTRPVTGIVANVVNGQLPFAKANGVLPINGGIAIPNNNNPALPVTTNGNMNGGLPLVTGLGGTVAQNGNNPTGSIPFVTASNLPNGATVQGLQFGTITVIDDELTESHELGSSVVGKAQGFYVASSQDGSSHTMAVTALLEEGGKYEDSICFFGVHRTVAHESYVAVIGGTGKYQGAKGYATVQSLHPADDHATDGVETLLQFTVYLMQH